MSTQTTNRTVRAHLNRITETERTRTVRIMVRVRAVLAFLYAVQNLWYVWFQNTSEAVTTSWVFVFYTVLAVVLVIGSDRSQFLSQNAGWAATILDIPTMVIAAWVTAPNWSTGKPEHALFSLIPFVGVGILASALALDVPAIIAATITATVGVIFVCVSINTPITEMIDPAFALVSLGALCVFMVLRIRGLVQESRRKDFAGKYVLGERIGSGGMAEVFEATYSPEGSFERRVAVKRVLPAYANDKDFIALFRREAEVGSRLAHPNLVQVLDFGRHQESYFLAMEYIEGVSLSAVLRSLHDSNERVPLAVANFIIAEVAEGLTYLQERVSPDGLSVGLVHRDLNPPNVLLSRSGEVKVSDFGVARWTDSGGLTQTGAVRGKLGYMAPEMVKGAPATPAGDLFALGAMAWEILAGKRLFTAPSDAELVRLILEQPLSPPSSVRPEIPAEVDAVVMGLLEREPNKRIASGRAVTQVLRSVTGAAAPYPNGREQLVALLVGYTFKAGPAPPSGGSARSSADQATSTLASVSPKSIQ